MNLHGTRVTDLTPLSVIISLRRLFLGGTQVQDLQPLAALSFLQCLDIPSTGVGACPVIT